MFTGTYGLRDATSGTLVQPAKPETDLGESPSRPDTPTVPPARARVRWWNPACTTASSHSGKRADINAASTSAGAVLIQWSANTGLNQQFDFLDSGGGHHRIRAWHSGLVLQVANSNTGTDVTQQADTNVTAQQWRVVDQGSSVTNLMNRQSGLAMEVVAASTADGAHISQNTATGAANQRFQLQRV